MTKAIRSLFLRASTAAVLVFMAGTAVEAQPPKTYGPEVVSILGGPQTSADSLDANVLAVLGQPENRAPDAGVVNARAADVSAKLRCPVCQGVSISDSPSGMATHMRTQVRELVAKGYSEEQIMSYFERSYGEFVRLEPPLRGLNVMLWILPAVVLLGGAYFVLRMARQPAPAMVSVEPIDTKESSPATDPALAKYLERVRRDSGTSS
jgi:cytochrome c-type biogenesis protein CcmH/NrfF